MEQNIDIEWSDADRSCLENLGFTVSGSMALKDDSACRFILRARELQIQSEMKTLAGVPLCASSGPTVLEALINLKTAWGQLQDDFNEMEDDIYGLCWDAEREYTRDEP